MDFENMSRRRLQSLAKQHGIKANLTSEVIKKELELKFILKDKQEVSQMENKTKELPYLPQELVNLIFEKKIKLETLDKIIKNINEAIDIDKYLSSSRNKQYTRAAILINKYYQDFFYINYLKIINKLDIKYTDNKNIIQNKTDNLIHMIIKILQKYTFLLENIIELQEFLIEDNENIEFYNNKQEEICDKITSLNNKMKNLKNYGFMVKKKYIKKINNSIKEINNLIIKINNEKNDEKNNIKKIEVFLETHRVSGIGTKSKSSSKSNSSTRKKSK